MSKRADGTRTVEVGPLDGQRICRHNGPRCWLCGRCASKCCKDGKGRSVPAGMRIIPAVLS